MVRIDLTYDGQLRCSARHAPSGTILQTDAPVDNQGKGESFSPTDLVATALGACMMTIMGIVAQRHQINLQGATATVLKEMTPQPTRRIGRLRLKFTIPAQLTDEHRQMLVNAAFTCPVHKSLHPDIQIPVEFEWG